MLSLSKFESAEQGSNDVMSFYSDLLDLATRLASIPDDYTISTQFIDGLKPSVRKELLQRGYTPEGHTLTQILKAAQSIENTEAYEARYNQRVAMRRMAKSTGDNHRKVVDEDKARKPSTLMTRKDSDKRSVTFSSNSC